MGKSLSSPGPQSSPELEGWGRIGKAQLKHSEFSSSEIALFWVPLTLTLKNQQDLPAPEEWDLILFAFKPTKQTKHLLCVEDSGKPPESLLRQKENHQECSS